LINQVVQELTLLGLSPEVVRGLVRQGNDVLHTMGEEHSSDEQTTVVIQPHTTNISGHTTTSPGHKLFYEVDNDLGHLVSRLRLVVDTDTDMDTAVSKTYVAKTQILTRSVKPYVPILASLENSLDHS
jgi:hypothetical protein